MNYDFRVEQLTLNPLARSAGVTDADLTRAEELLDDAGYPFETEAFFVVAFDSRRVAVVRARPGRAVHFHLWHAPTYARLGDPFRLSDRVPPASPERGLLPTVDTEPVPVARPPASDLIRRLAEADMPLVLGATQALLDGVQVCLTPSDATEETLRLVWDLLPDSARGTLWPHTGATARTRTGFHATITAAAVIASPGRLTAEQCRDYPEGEYELALQSALERGDQGAVDGLFARRSSQDALRTAALLLVLTLGSAVVARLVV